MYAILLRFGILCTVFYAGYNYGSYSVEVKHYHAILKHNAKVEQILKLNKAKEVKYHEEITSLNEQLKANQKTYKENISRINADASDRLHKSELRSKVLEERAKACSPEYANLAKYSAKLHRQLTEGVNLVEELRELIKLRDKQLILVGEQLKSDRKVLE